ncbi:MAG TPA: tetratricopeptide repeat protein [Blastocatellia bacterium]|nr:tetratricopeptide repeat protein [Blastocatellia bacterium]
MNRCTNKRIGRWIGSYELNALEEDERRIFMDHLVECEYCYNQVYSIEPFMIAFRNHRSAALRGEAIRHSSSFEQLRSTPRRAWSWRLVPAMAALSLIIGVSLYVVYSSKQDPQSDSTNIADLDSRWKEIEIPKAPYTPSSETVILRKKNKAFDHAMAAYQENDFPSAIEQLETISELEPDSMADVGFYLGVSLLLAGRNRDAIAPLKQSVQSGVGPLRESSHYYLALAYLKNNQPQQSLAELDATIAMNGKHRADAESLKEQVSSLSRYF